MRVISQRKLREFWSKHGDAQTSLILWYQRTIDAKWQNLADVRKVFPSADLVGNLTVFNIGGNKYRLITFIDYESQIVFTRNVLTHAEYDKRCDPASAKDARERAPRRRNGKMTTGLKTPSSYYLQLINTFPPRPINNEAELLATQEQIDVIIDQPNITQDDKDYLKVLGTLVYEYEQKHEPIPVLKGIELIQALMIEENLQPRDLVAIFDDESTVTKILERKQEITTKQIQKLGDFFHIAPVMFL
jgi:HTH-type transcriptional regulator/antitoxin HigA